MMHFPISLPVTSETHKSIFSNYVTDKVNRSRVQPSVSRGGTKTELERVAEIEPTLDATARIGAEQQSRCPQPSTVEPRCNDPRYNDIPGITMNLLCPGRSYSKMNGTEP